jgi:hypothetical protein
MIDDYQTQIEDTYTSYDWDKFMYERGNRAFRLLAAAIHDLDLDAKTEAKLASIANEARDCLVDSVFIEGVVDDYGEIVAPRGDDAVDLRGMKAREEWSRYDDGRPIACVIDCGKTWGTLLEHPDQYRESWAGLRGSTTDFRPLEPELWFEDWMEIVAEQLKEDHGEDGDDR